MRIVYTMKIEHVLKDHFFLTFSRVFFFKKNYEGKKLSQIVSLVATKWTICPFSLNEAICSDLYIICDDFI